MSAETKCEKSPEGQQNSATCEQLNTLDVLKPLEKIDTLPQAQYKMLLPDIYRPAKEYMEISPYKELLKREIMKLAPEEQSKAPFDHKQLNNYMESMKAAQDIESPSEKLEAQIREQLSGQKISAGEAIKSFAELFHAVKNEFGLEPGTLNKLMRGQEQMRGKQMSADVLEPWMNVKGIPEHLDKDARLDLQGVVENANDLLDLFRKSFPGYPPEKMDELLQAHQDRLSGNFKNRMR